MTGIANITGSVATALLVGVICADLGQAAKVNRVVEIKEAVLAANGQTYNVTSIVRLRDKQAITVVANVKPIQRADVRGERAVSFDLALPLLKEGCHSETRKKIVAPEVAGHVEEVMDFETGKPRYMWQFEVSCR